MEALEANLVYPAVLEAASCSDGGLRTAVVHESGEHGVVTLSRELPGEEAVAVVSFTCSVPQLPAWRTTLLELRDGAVLAGGGEGAA